jgi:hypothetical protein
MCSRLPLSYHKKSTLPGPGQAVLKALGPSTYLFSGERKQQLCLALTTGPRSQACGQDCVPGPILPWVCGLHFARLSAAFSPASGCC